MSVTDSPAMWISLGIPVSGAVLLMVSHVNKITPLLLQLFVSFPVSAPDSRLPSASTHQIHSWTNFAVLLKDSDTFLD